MSDMAELRTQNIGIRVTPAVFARISELAGARGMSKTDYIVAAALGELDVDPSDVETRLSRVERGLARLEQLAQDQSGAM